MFRVCVLVVAAMASLCGHQARAELNLSRPSMRPKVGEKIAVLCTVSGGETFSGWYKPGGSRVTDTPTATIRVEASGNTYKLTFADVKVSQGGKYQCRGSKNSKDFLLQVAFDTSAVDHVQHVTIGQSGTIQLGVTGFPKPSFKWMKGKTEIKPDTDARYTLRDDGSLVIGVVKKDDQGNYTCDVGQSGYLSDEHIEVYAVEYPKIAPFPKPRKYLTKGYPASFVCTATGNPPPKYKWIAPTGKELVTWGNIHIKDGNMTFRKVEPNLRGIYTCKAYNVIEKTGEKIGEVEAKVEVVDVYEAATITSQAGDVVLNRGQEYKLECKATGKPKPSVMWMKNGERDPRQKQSEGESFIEFRNIQVVDGGKYTCEARNSAVDSNGKTIVATLDKNINIKSPPYINRQASPGNIYSYVGNSAPTYVSCTFGGYPKPFVTMTFKGKLMSNATTTANVSVITDAKKKFGSYRCYAKNDYGFKNQTVELKEVGKPSVVLDLKADELTCNSVTLKWTRPLEDGGMPINKYVLTYDSVTRNIDGKKTSHTITELKQNTVHKFVIRATNKGEWGPTTMKEVKTTEYCAPGQPIIYKPEFDTEITETSFTLKWKRPDDTGGDDDIEYIVRYREEPKNETPGPWKEVKTWRLEYDVEDLEQNTYRFEVFAQNKGGKSSASQRIVTVSPTQEKGSQSRLVASGLATFMMGVLHLL